ncbi:MAG: DUF1641 domain-containing protein [Leptospirales bacterium]
MVPESIPGKLLNQLSESSTEKMLSEILTRLEVIQEFHIASKALWDIQTNSLVERVAETVEKATAMLDRLTHPETLLLIERLEKSTPVLTRIIDILDSGEKTGAFSSLVEIGSALKAAQRLGTDTLIERVASQAEKTTEFIDKMQALPIEDLIGFASELRKSGGLESLTELVGAVSAVRKLLTDSLVERVMLLLEEAISWQGNVANVFGAIPAAPTEAPGIFGIIGLLKDPETQKALSFFLSGMKEIHRAIRKGE